MATGTVNVKFKLRRDTKEGWESNPVLALGEPGYETTNSILKVGDGVKPWNNLTPVNSTLNSSNSIVFDGGTPSTSFSIQPVFDCGGVA